MEIKQTNKIEADKVNCLIYGPPGHGKTTLASTLTGSTVIVSLESGLLSLRDFNIDYIDIKNLNDLRTALEDLAKSDYNNIFIDSLSAISELFLEQAKREEPDAKNTMKMYGKVLEYTTKFIKYTRDINRNIFFTALNKTTTDEIGRRFQCPDLVGSISTKIAGYLDFVLFMRVIEVDGEMKRVLVTESTDSAVAKDRSGKLSPHENPDLGAIISKVFA